MYQTSSGFKYQSGDRIESIEIDRGTFVAIVESDGHRCVAKLPLSLQNQGSVSDFARAQGLALDRCTNVGSYYSSNGLEHPVSTRFIRPSVVPAKRFGLF
jgi:hypothetical protein